MNKVIFLSLCAFVFFHLFNKVCIVWSLFINSICASYYPLTVLVCSYIILIRLRKCVYPSSLLLLSAADFMVFLADALKGEDTFLSVVQHGLKASSLHAPRLTRAKAIRLRHAPTSWAAADEEPLTTGRQPDVILL